jgi:cell division cycle 14
MGIYCVLFLDMPADEAYRPLTTLKPFAPFRDASCGASTFHLTVLDCLRGMERAKAVGFVDISQRQWRFNLQEYEYYEQVRAKS